MSYYYETARTNYFSVKDQSLFLAFIKSLNCATTSTDDKNRFCVLFNEDGIPNQRFNDAGDSEDYGAEAFMIELSEHLKEDSIAILMASGSEGIRFICGYAFAVNSKGEIVEVNIGEIYLRAEEKFGKKEITLAEY